MFLLLIKVRVAGILNMVQEQFRRSAWVASGMASLGTVLFVAILFGFQFLFRIAGEMSLLREMLYQVFYFLFLFLLAGSTPFVASTLLHSSDYSLLFSAPIPARSVLAAKLVDATVTNSLQFMVLGVPVLVAGALALPLNFVGWLILPLLIVLFVLVPALFTALGLLLLLAALGAPRLRAAITLLNAVLASVACITIVLESPHLPVHPGMDPFAAVSTELGRSSPAAHIVPSAWFVDVLTGLAGAHGSGGALAMVAVLKIGALVVFLWVCCIALGSRLISAANLAEAGSTRIASNDSEVSGGLSSSPLGALLRKDWKYLKRDSILMSQLCMPLILFAVPFILTLQDPSRKQYGETYYFAAAIVGVILFMQTSILSLSSVGLESRAYWIVMTAPVTAEKLLAAKFLLSTLFSAAVGVTLTLIAALLFGAGIAAAAIEVGFVIVSAAALSGLGVGLAAAFPRFIYENPAHRVSVWALVLGFFASTAYIMVSGILFAAAWVVASNLPPGSATIAAYGVATFFYLVISACAIWAPISLGARRIQGYQWEH